MLEQKQFVEELQKAGIDFFVGVPDSFLNGFCTYIAKNIPETNHVIAANEGNAVSIAAGHYLATQKIPLVYMQNSGLGNAINPLVSLADDNVYAIPMLLLIGWRGEPGIGDWAQHKRQGEITTKLLEDMDIPYAILGKDTDVSELISEVAEMMAKNRKPFALIAKKGVLAGEKNPIIDDSYPMSRENAIEILLEQMPEDTIFVATTGRATRELYFLREKRNEGHSNDFLNVGSMGHASSVALGLAMANQKRKVVCLDGDSAAIMHMGALTMVSKINVPNLLHVVLNNGAHESVGGQLSAGHLVDFTKIAEGSGYCTINEPVTNEMELIEAIKKLENAEKAAFIDVWIRKGIRKDLGSLKISHSELITELMEEMKK